MSHLQNIATRQRRSIIRDVLFATLLAVAAVVSVSTVNREVHPIVAHR